MISTVWLSSLQDWGVRDQAYLSFRTKAFRLSPQLKCISFERLGLGDPLDPIPSGVVLQITRYYEFKPYLIKRSIPRTRNPISKEHYTIGLMCLQQSTVLGNSTPH